MSLYFQAKSFLVLLQCAKLIRISFCMISVYANQSTYISIILYVYIITIHNGKYMCIHNIMFDRKDPNTEALAICIYICTDCTYINVPLSIYILFTSPSAKLKKTVGKFFTSFHWKWLEGLLSFSDDVFLGVLFVLLFWDIIYLPWTQ